MKDDDAVVFWLTFFKAQLSCTADEFFNAIKETCELNLIPHFFEENLNQYKREMLNFEGVISLKQQNSFIKECVKSVVNAATKSTGFNALRDQVRTRQGRREPTELVNESKIKVLNVEDEPSFGLFAGIQGLSSIKLH